MIQTLIFHLTHITKTNLLVLLRGKISVCFKNHSWRVNILCRKIPEKGGVVLNVTVRVVSTVLNLVCVIFIFQFRSQTVLVALRK